MTTSIDVSVIIAAWKAASFVETAIASAFASTNVVIEVIAVDDASPDSTFEVLSRIASNDPRVTAIRLQANSGPSAARNRAIAAANGRYVAVLDADDTMLPDRLASLVALADASKADIAVDNMINVNEAGVALADNPFLKSPKYKTACDIDLTTWIDENTPLASGDALGYLKPLIRRNKLIENGITYDTELRNSEDYYLVAELLAANAHMVYMPSAGYRYTRSSSSTSHRLKPEQTSAWLVAEKQFVARYGANLPQSARDALQKRGQTLRNINHLVAVTDALKTKDFVRSVKLLTSDLRGASFTVGTLAKVVAGKALGR